MDCIMLALIDSTGLSDKKDKETIEKGFKTQNYYKPNFSLILFEIYFCSSRPHINFSNVSKCQLY